MLKKLAAHILVGAMLAASPVMANAQEGIGDYPERSVTLVIPFGLGSGDAQARAFAQIAEEYLGQTIVPSNHPGGNQAIGLNFALRQPADGYTLLFLSGSFPLAVARGQLDYEITDVRPIIAFNADYLVIAVREDSPFETFEELAEHARENPGDLNIGGTVRGGTHHIFAELVMAGGEIDMNYVPYEGSSETLVALLGGDLDVMATSPSTVRQYVETGEVRLLGVSTRDRVDAYPDVPTFYEMGMEQISDFINYRGYYAHPDTPDEIIEYLSETFTKVYETEEWHEYLKVEQQIPFYRNHEELAQHVQAYYEKIQSILKDMED